MEKENYDMKDWYKEVKDLTNIDTYNKIDKNEIIKSVNFCNQIDLIENKICNKLDENITFQNLNLSINDIFYCLKLSENIISFGLWSEENFNKKISFKEKIKYYYLVNNDDNKSELYIILETNLLLVYTINKLLENDIIFKYQLIENLKNIIIREKIVYYNDDSNIYSLDINDEIKDFENQKLFEFKKKIDIFKISFINNFIIILSNYTIYVTNMNGFILNKFDFKSEDIYDILTLKYEIYNKDIKSINYDIFNKDFILIVTKNDLLIYDLSIYNEEEKKFKLIEKINLNLYFKFDLDFSNKNNYIIKFDISGTYLFIINKVNNIVIVFKINSLYNKNIENDEKNIDFFTNFEIIKCHNNIIQNIINHNNIDNFIIISNNQNIVNIYNYQNKISSMTVFNKTQINKNKQKNVVIRSKIEINKILEENDNKKENIFENFIKDNLEIIQNKNKTSKNDFNNEILNENKSESSLNKLENIIKNNDEDKQTDIWDDSYKELINNELIKIESKLIEKLHENNNLNNHLIIQNQINDILDNMRTNVKELILNNFSHSFEEIALPVLEKYLTKIFEKINYTLDKGLKFYNEKINIESRKGDLIKNSYDDILKEIINTMEILTKSVKDIASKKEDKINQENQSNNDSLLKKLNEVLETQNLISNDIKYLNNRLLNIENHQNNLLLKENQNINNKYLKSDLLGSQKIMGLENFESKEE